MIGLEENKQLRKHFEILFLGFKELRLHSNPSLTPVKPNKRSSSEIFLYHWVKSVLIRSYSSVHLPAFGLNKERYSVCLYSVRKRENADQNNSEYGQFLSSVLLANFYYHDYIKNKTNNVFCLRYLFFSKNISTIDTINKWLKNAESSKALTKLFQNFSVNMKFFSSLFSKLVNSLVCLEAPLGIFLKIENVWEAWIHHTK